MKENNTPTETRYERIYRAVGAVLHENGAPNPERLAHQIARSVSVAILPIDQRRVYEALTDTPEPVSIVAELADMDSKTVASQLMQLEKKTLARAVANGVRNKKWARYE
jgi:predicted Rossmann fold nucleotide-binding protein DprA/Smf involved in DNA uptake